MKFQARLTLTPTWHFGLPDGDATVVPVNSDGKAQVCSSVLDTELGVVAAHGTLPLYRRDSEAISISGQLSGLHFEISDNLLWVQGEAQNCKAAGEAVDAAVTRLVQNLSLSYGARFEANRMALQCDESKQPTRRSFQLLNLRTYDIPSLVQRIEKAFTYAGLDDERLAHALRYYDAALQVQSLTLPNTLQVTPLAALEFLTLWKALTTILGDPAVRKDQSQSRYRTLGFADDVRDEFLQLKSIRDDHDVAHYSLDPTALNRVSAALPLARTLAHRVIQKYRDDLLDDGAGSARVETGK